MSKGCWILVDVRSAGVFTPMRLASEAKSLSMSAHLAAANHPVGSGVFAQPAERQESG